MSWPEAVALIGVAACIAAVLISLINEENSDE